MLRVTEPTKTPRVIVRNRGRKSWSTVRPESPAIPLSAVVWADATPVHAIAASAKKTRKREGNFAREIMRAAS